MFVAALGRKKDPLSRALDLREADSTFVRFTGKTFGGSSCRLLGGGSSYLWFVLRAPGYFLIEPEPASAKTLIVSTSDRGNRAERSISRLLGTAVSSSLG